MNIEPYIQIKSPIEGLNFNLYLHIRGGAGNYSTRTGNNRYGGEYDYILFYASPDEMEGCDICERIWCENKGIVYGEGDTIEAAHENWQSKSSI